MEKRFYMNGEFFVQASFIPVLYIVVPCYNEEEVLPESSKTFLSKLKELITEKEISDDSRILFVNDGSKDRTWELIQQIHVLDYHFAGLSLSRNRGHQNAVLAGLMTVKDHADISISIDADLQDDINVINQMIKKYKEGAQIVYGVRNARTTDSFFKRFTAESFYRLMQMMGVELVFNHADYRLMTKTALEAL
ncbi:MAG: glycosyltransferase family 2 protein, partial [Pyramidobacter sp.]|nr:glycosyltransferase family 2 protein [Pyramidobacter sp.]